MGVHGRRADVTLIGKSLDRWATLTMAYQNNRQLHDTILNMFVRSYDLIDSAYWPAYVAAAQYFQLHDDPEQALDELQSALSRQPARDRGVGTLRPDFDRAF